MDLKLNSVCLYVHKPGCYKYISDGVYYAIIKIKNKELASGHVYVMKHGSSDNWQ